MKHLNHKLLLAVSLSVFTCFQSVAAEPLNFGENADSQKIRDASDYCSVFQLPDGDACEVFFKRSDESSFAEVSSPNGGVYILNMQEGYEISYAFLVDDGEKELYLQEGIVEPVYIQSYNKHSKGPSTSLNFTYNHNQGSRILYDLPSGYEYHGKNGKELKIQKIVTITSLNTGEYDETKYSVLFLKDLEYRKPDADRRIDSIHMYEVKKGDCLWNISKKIYGTPEKWISIYNANQSSIKNSDLIYVGQKLAIP